MPAAKHTSTVTVLSKDKHYGVRSVEEFLTDDLPSLVDRLDKPKPTNEYNFNLSAQDLVDLKRYQQAKEEQGQHQYG
jgi:hypothetical protein